MAFPSYAIRSYSGSAQSTTLASAMSGTDLTFTVVNASTWKEINSTNSLGTTGTFVVAVDFGTTTEEKILCSSVNTSTGVVTVWSDGSGNNGRGYDGSTAQGHSPGSSSPCVPVLSATEAKEFNKVSNVVGLLETNTTAGALLTTYASGGNAVSVLTAGTAGQILTSQGSVSGIQWANPAAPKATVSATAPSSPVIGNLWYNTNVSQLEVWNGTAWVVATPSPLPATIGTAGQVLSTNGTNTVWETLTVPAANNAWFASYGTVIAVSSSASTNTQLTVSGFTTYLITTKFQLVATPSGSGNIGLSYTVNTGTLSNATSTVGQYDNTGHGSIFTDTRVVVASTSGSITITPNVNATNGTVQLNWFETSIVGIS